MTKFYRNPKEFADDVAIVVTNDELMPVFKIKKNGDFVLYNSDDFDSSISGLIEKFESEGTWILVADINEDEEKIEYFLPQVCSSNVCNLAALHNGHRLWFNQAGQIIFTTLSDDSYFKNNKTYYPINNPMSEDYIIEPVEEVTEEKFDIHKVLKELKKPITLYNTKEGIKKQIVTMKQNEWSYGLVWFYDNFGDFSSIKIDLSEY